MSDMTKEGFIGSKLKSIPLSSLLYYKEDQLLLKAKRQVFRLDLPTQSMAYCKPDQEKILHTTYHSLLGLYLVLTEKHLMAINAEGQLIRKLPNEALLGSKYFFMCTLKDGYSGVPNNRQDFGLFVKGDHFYSCSLQVFFERQLIKNKGICDFHVSFGTPLLHESPEYIENSKLLQAQGLLLLWNANQTYVYAVPRMRGDTLKRVFIYSKISRRENLSLDYAVIPAMKLMAVGYQSGIIKIYAFQESRKYLAQLRGHQASCLSLLVPTKSEGFLYSGSADSTVRIWNLYDFQQVYVLQLDLIVSTLTIISSQLLFATSDEAHPKSYLCNLNADLLEPVVNQNQGGELLRLSCDGVWCIAIYSNNHVQFFPATLPRAPNQKLEYPEKYGAVREVFALDGDYAVALENGFSVVRFNKWQVSAQSFQLTKLVYNESIGSGKGGQEFIELIHEKLLGTYLFNVLLDWKEIPVSLKVSAVYFHRSSCLPKWDGTLKGQPQQQEKYYCLLGSMKGEIFFVDLANRTHYYSKVYFHTAEVTFIREVKGKGTTIFLSISADRQLVVWRFGLQDPPQALTTLSFNREFTFKQVFQNYLVLGQKSGQLSIIVVQTDEGIAFKKSSSTSGHIRSVICADHLPHKKGELFLSGGEDSIIKIWKGPQKQLIFQLKLFGIISAACFIRESLNLIVCHNEQISFIRQERLKGLGMAAKALDEPSASPQCEIFNMRAFLLGEKPRSPIKHHRLSKMASRYIGFAPQPFKVQDLQSIAEIKHLNHVESYAPVITKPLSNLFPSKSDSERKLQKPRRFHIPSTEELSSDFSLPRISLKSSVGQKIIPSKRLANDIYEIKKKKSKSYSRQMR